VAKLVFTNVRAFLSGTDFTGVSNKFGFETKYEDKDTTNYGSGGVHERIAGLVDTQVAGAGFWEAGTIANVDDELATNKTTIEPFTIAPTGTAFGAVTYLSQILWLDRKLFGSVGDVAPWELSAGGSWPMVRGAVANSPGTPITVTGNGSGVQLGAVAAGQRLYATLHVLSISGTGGPTLTVKIQSGTTSGFPAPVDQLTFSAATTVSGQILRTTGSAITDTWYRAAFTVAGSSPSFLATIGFGIA